MKKWITTLGVVVLGTCFAVTAFAGYGNRKGHGWGPGSSWKGSDTPQNLTEEQQARLEALHDDFYADTADIRHELWTKRDELGILLDRSDPDLEKAKSLQKEISDLRGRMAQKRLQKNIEARQVAPDASFGRGHGKAKYGRHHTRGDGQGFHRRGEGRRPCGY